MSIRFSVDKNSVLGRLSRAARRSILPASATTRWPVTAEAIAGTNKTDRCTPTFTNKRTLRHKTKVTLGAHAPEGYSTWSVCLSVCVCVCFPYSGTSRNQAYKQQYQRLQRDAGMKYKKGFFFKTLRSEVMASFIHLEWLWRRFRDPSAVVLSTKLGSTLLRKPIATVSLRRQRTSRRQRANLHRLVNGDVYGSRILIATPTSLSHVRATR